MMDGSRAVPNLEIVDNVLIPEGLPAGEYVLGWRFLPLSTSFAVLYILGSAS